MCAIYLLEYLYSWVYGEPTEVISPIEVMWAKAKIVAQLP